MTGKADGAAADRFAPPGWKLAGWRLSGWVLLVMLACGPLLYPAVPPLTDLPAHMSRIMVQMDSGRSADIARWYSFRWNLLPNLGTDLIALGLEPLVGLRMTMKIVAIAVVALQVAGYLLLSRAAHGRVTPLAVFAVPLALGNPFQYGFLNFTLGTALATLALAAWIGPMLRARPALRWALFVPVACAVWVCHLAAWAMLCVMVGCCELAARHRETGRLAPALIGGALASSCLLVPQVAALFWPDPSGHLPSHGWFQLAPKLYFLANVLADRWELWDMAGAALLVLLVWHSWRNPARFARHEGLMLGAAALLAVFFVVPSWALGSFYADMRLTPMIYALALIATSPAAALPGPARRRLWAGALAFALLRLAGNTASMALWDEQIASEKRVLAAVPRGSQLLTFVATPCRTFVLLGRIRDTHIASYALIERRAFANDQWAMQGGQLLSVSNPAAGEFQTAENGKATAEPCRGEEPLMETISRIPAAVPALWLVWHAPERTVPGWTPAVRSGNSVLYRRQTP